MATDMTTATPRELMDMDFKVYNICGKVRPRNGKGRFYDEYKDTETVKYRFVIDAAGTLSIVRQELHSSFTGVVLSEGRSRAYAAGSWTGVEVDIDDAP